MHPAPTYIFTQCIASKASARHRRGYQCASGWSRLAGNCLHQGLEGQLRVPASGKVIYHFNWRDVVYILFLQFSLNSSCAVWLNVSVLVVPWERFADTLAFKACRAKSSGGYSCWDLHFETWPKNWKWCLSRSASASPRQDGTGVSRTLR